MIQRLMTFLQVPSITKPTTSLEKDYFFPKRLPEHLDVIFFEEYIRTLRIPLVWGTVLFFGIVLLVICYYASNFAYFREWIYIVTFATLLTFVELYWGWEVTRRFGYRNQLTILNIVLAFLVSTISWGIIGAWQTMSQSYIGMMTTIIGSILGAGAVILAYSRVSYMTFMLGWIIPGLVFMFSKSDPFFLFMGILFTGGIFSFTFINIMEHAKQRQLFDANHQLTEINNELVRKENEIDQELLFASHIQMGIFPEPKTQIPYWKFQTTVLPLGRISGDYCDIVTRDNVTFVIMADASGHGVPAALLTMAAKNVFANTLIERISPAFALAKCNREILKMIKTQDYMTGFLLKMYPSGLVEFSNAAHPTAFHLHSDGRVKALDTSGFILGGLEDVDALYENGSKQLLPEERLFLYTDGVTESTNHQNKFYGVERLEKLLQKSATFEASKIIPTVFSDVVGFCEGEPFRDDIAMMVIEYAP
ncbi:MAG TPA: PP2C family protein-serine/threonine phosphatase [Turneriella sp.]|nr:PP2C family protein-serine/threonine phosphatase [Turneriella sp.]